MKKRIVMMLVVTVMTVSAFTGCGVKRTIERMPLEAGFPLLLYGNMPNAEDSSLHFPFRT